jgi:hypothetical protein
VSKPPDVVMVSDLEALEKRLEDTLDARCRARRARGRGVQIAIKVGVANPAVNAVSRALVASASAVRSSRLHSREDAW